MELRLIFLLGLAGCACAPAGAPFVLRGGDLPEIATSPSVSIGEPPAVDPEPPAPEPPVPEPTGGPNKGLGNGNENANPHDNGRGNTDADNPGKGWR